MYSRLCGIPPLFRFSGLVFVLFVFGFTRADALILPDTGITTCYDAAGQAIVCPVPGEAYYGQDAHFGPGAMSYLDNGDGTCTENNTRLIWEQKVSADGQVDPASFGDADNRYRWDEAQTLVAQLNAAAYLGQSDWRLPSSTELAYLVDLSVAEPGPTITQDAFPNTQAGCYWTADADSADALNAWAVDFANAADILLAKTDSCFVRVVRGGVQ